MKGKNAVGFAGTDENYNIIKKHQKHLFGVRAFEEGKPAQERRVFRASRRRLQRKKERIKLLQELLQNEIDKIDRGFFQRLNESMFHIEDKDVYQSNTLFHDKNYTDKDYHKTYPTVYHLRKALMMGQVKDARLLYLGIEHIIKNSGHFLFPEEEFGEI